MKIQGEHHFRAPRESVWQAVLDPKILSSSLPGFQRLDSIGENEYEGALEIKVGPVQGDFQGTLKLSDLKEPSSYRFRLNGMGAAGFVDGEGLLVLEEAGGGTRLHYDLDAKVGGRIAGVGQRLLDSSAKVLARQTLEGLEQQVMAHSAQPSEAPESEVDEAQPSPDSSRAAAPDAAAPPASAAAPASPELTAGAPKGDVRPAPATNRIAGSASATSPSQARFALTFAKGLAGELIPPARRPWVISAALIVYTIVIILLTRACSG